MAVSVRTITQEQIRECYIFHHRKMWNWIADQTLKLKRKVTKEEYFEAMGIPKCDRPLNLCYCCDFAKVPSSYGGCEPMCQLCPIDWMSNDRIYMCEYRNLARDYGLFTRWRLQYDSNYKEAARLARTIANLPES